MKKTGSISAMIVAGIILISGCDSSDSSVGDGTDPTKREKSLTAIDHSNSIGEFDLGDLTVQLLTMQFDRQSRTLTIGLRATELSGASQFRSLRLSQAESDSSVTSTIELLDPNHQLLFGYSTEIPSDSLYWSRITEYTIQDELSWTRTLGTNFVSENYQFNSEATIGLSMSDALYSALLDGTFGRSDSLVAEAESLSALFESWYPTEHSLSDNPSGLLMARLIALPQFQSWLELHFASELDNVRFSKDISLEDVCTVAWVCAAIKCNPILAGGPHNPLCVPCAGIDLACSIVGVVNFIRKWF